MLSSSGLTTAEVLEVFTDEIAVRGGRVTETFDDGRRLFTRSVLPQLEEDVRPGDRLQGGVAMKAAEEGVCLYPYLFRLVCRNGAIVARTLEARFLEDLHLQEPETALVSIREGVEACCAPEVFAETVCRVRTACEADVDLLLNLMPLISHLSTRSSAAIVSQIMDRFFRDGDPTRFGLANAITAVARDTRDPDVRWNLEEFGGGIAVGAVPPQPADGGALAVSATFK